MKNIERHLFSCPECLGELVLQDDDSESLCLDCPECIKSYPQKNSIFRFVPLNNYSDSFGYQWNKFRETQLDSHTGKSISEDRLSKIFNWKDDLKDKKVLEAGSGAGRFTEVLVRSAGALYSFDYSSAVEANFINNKSAENLNIFQGDIFKIPFRDNSFDYVLCLGVIQHTPNPREAFMSLKKKLKPGGSIFIDCYALKWHHYLQWKYVLRPLTKRMNQVLLFNIISILSPLMIPAVRLSKSIFGKVGSRIFPIVEYSELLLEKKINRDWSVLDTFDMYSPEHDHPQTLKEVRSWFGDEEFENIEVWYGDNGVVAKADKRI